MDIQGRQKILDSGGKIVSENQKIPNYCINILIKISLCLIHMGDCEKIIVMHVVNMRVVSIVYEELLNQVKGEERKQPLNMGKIFF